MIILMVLHLKNKISYQLLLDAALSGKIEEVYDDENFVTKLLLKEFKKD
jgi:hypothetical protein